MPTWGATKDGEMSLPSYVLDIPCEPLSELLVNLWKVSPLLGGQIKGETGATLLEAGEFDWHIEFLGGEDEAMLGILYWGEKSVGQAMLVKYDSATAALSSNVYKHALTTHMLPFPSP